MKLEIPPRLKQNIPRALVDVKVVYPVHDGCNDRQSHRQSENLQCLRVLYLAAFSGPG